MVYNVETPPTTATLAFAPTSLYSAIAFALPSMAEVSSVRKFTTTAEAFTVSKLIWEGWLCGGRQKE